jgi:hypothetical protein
MKIDGLIESISEGYHTFANNLASSFESLIKRIIAYVGCCFGYGDKEPVVPQLDPILYTKTHAHLIELEEIDKKTTRVWMENRYCDLEISETESKMVATLSNQHMGNDLLHSFAEVIGTFFSRSTSETLEIRTSRDTHYNAMTRQGFGKYDCIAVNAQQFTLIVAKEDAPIFDHIESYS